MVEPRKLAIDDCRELSYCDLLARTYDEGIKALKFLGPWDELYLDHDLGAVRPCFNEHGREMTGSNVAQFIADNPELAPKRVILITDNPVGRQRMLSILKEVYGTEFNGH